MSCINPEIAQHIHPDRPSFPAQSSVLSERAIFHRVLPLYQLPTPPRSCRFLTRGDSDVYLVTTETQNYYLKIRRAPISTAQCNAEARLILHLAANNIPVVTPIPLHQSNYAIEIQASEGPRPILLFQAAPPHRADDFTIPQATQFGQMLTNLHRVADLQPIDPALPQSDPNAAQESVQQITAAISLTDDQSQILNHAAHLITATLINLPRTSPHFGPIHGDLARSNIRRDNTGHHHLFDFGAAERGWRINELANVYRQTLPQSTAKNKQELWQAFLTGYSQSQPVPPSLNSFLRINALSAKLSHIAYICTRLPLRLGIEVIDEHNIPNHIQEIKHLIDESDLG